MAERRITDPEVQILAGLASTMRADFADRDLAWEGSPFAWIRTRPSRQRGKIGELLVAGWCATKGLDVTKAPDSECDKVIEGIRTEIKFSTLWATGGFKFQQFRDQDYGMAICLGLCPFEAYCWVLPKLTLKEHVIGHTGQHGGRGGTDTAWLHVDPDNVQDWLGEWGGRLNAAARVLRRLADEK